MDKEEKEKFKLGAVRWPLILLQYLVVIAVAIVVILYWYAIQDDENITVEGKIVSVKLIDDNSNKNLYDVLLICFDSGDCYKIINNLGDDVDFTVNSKFIMKLHRPDVDSNWIVEQIYRVP